jgi:hypothetical protein
MVAIGPVTTFVASVRQYPWPPEAIINWIFEDANETDLPSFATGPRFADVPPENISKSVEPDTTNVRGITPGPESVHSPLSGESGRVINTLSPGVFTSVTSFLPAPDSSFSTIKLRQIWASAE